MATGVKSLPSEQNRFETTAWKLMRLSGVLIIPLAFIHLGIMHVINSVYTIDYQWVIEKRWAMLGWRIYDAFFLWFAGLHGFNGLRMVVKDYVHNETAFRAIGVGMVILMIVIFALGTIALIGAPLQPVLPSP